MDVRAHLMMVMVLDKCLGCHTCSVTCKQAWTNRDGVDYAWFNNVETKPGAGYPKRWEDQDRWKGGWELDGKGVLRLRAGGRAQKLLTIFGNFDLPVIDDYYEPWTYDYASLIDEPITDGPPVATARSRLTGRPLDLEWGPNWDDDLAGFEPRQDPAAAALGREVLKGYQDVFLFYLPRICNHCLNPSCVASCPQGAMYKRESDGIVLVDQDMCRAWRFCVSGCPYKKVYFNHVTTKSEKCLFCYAGVTEDGLPTICSESCVGRIRYLGVVLYDMERVTEAAQTPDEADLVEAQRSLLLDPFDPQVVKAAQANGIPQDWLEAARRSPVYALVKEFKVALPLHPEYRNLPMVWYVPPLSPLVTHVEAGGTIAAGRGPDGTGGGAGLGDPDGAAGDPTALFAAVRDMRIPLDYVAGILAAGDSGQVEDALRRLIAMRAHKRQQQLTGRGDGDLPASVGLDTEQLERMYRLLAVGARDERYVIPKARFEEGGALQTQHRQVGHRRKTRKERRPWS